VTTTATRAPSTPPPAPAPAPAAAGSVLARRRAAAAESIRASLSGSPGRLRILGAAAIAVCIVGGVLGAFALQQRAAALDRAQADTAQLVRVQSIFINLVKADAAATNAYLIPGLEPPEQRADYDKSLDGAARQIAEASLANSQDAVRLGAVNTTLTRYAGLVEAARANNREGRPIGSAYIRQASTLLRSPAGIGALDQVLGSAGKRVESAYGRSSLATWLLVGAGLLVLGGLVGVQVSLARRSHRYVNLPVAAGSAVLVIALIGGAVVMLSAQGRADDVRDGAYRNTVALALARIFAFDAKAQESLSLINRGSGRTVYQPKINTDIKKAQQRLDTTESVGAGSRTDLRTWSTKDQQIRGLDNDGDWDGAVALATGVSANGETTSQADSNEVFAAFDKSSAEALDAQARAATSGLGEPQAPLLIVAVLLLLAGIAAAVASWAGVSLRLEEYR
jgi:hypothetical protein